MHPGLTGTADLHVTTPDTAAALGSGDVDVLGTPRVVALAEAATVAAVASALEPGETTVGTRVELDHLRPSRVGADVRAAAELVPVDGRRLTFAVQVTEGDVVVARGSVIRARVDRDGFASA
jgi:fluoroacetyl-CoA thioesterase